MSYEQSVEIGMIDDACAVCAMPLAGAPVTKVQHLAINLVVCSPECAEAFYKDPNRYRPVDGTEEE